jgi:hypothetical protein
MGLKIRSSCAVVICSLAVSLTVVAQNDTPKPKVSGKSLTPEQVAVYRAVLEDYTRGWKAALNLANKTEPLEESGPFSTEGCIQGLQLEAGENSVPVIHQLDSSVTLNLRIVLVDPHRQQEKIKKGDPQNLIKKSIDDHEKVTDKQLDNSVKQAFNNGLFTLSEIRFNKEHRRAVLTYSFTCGMLCGHGNTLILKKVGEKWKVDKKCGGWIS